MNWPVFSYAFRPFFLLAPLYAVLATIVWLLALHGRAPAFMPAAITDWHAHEMLIGFGLGAVAGFVLTAVATWTGRSAVSGGPLVLLVLCWLSGRVAMFTAGAVPPLITAVTDMLFPTLLLLLVAREVMLADNRRNLPIVLIIAGLAGLNLLYHLGHIGAAPRALQAERIGMFLFLHLLLVLITVIAGRIVPAFTTNWLRARNAARLPATYPVVDRATIGVTALAGLYLTFLPASRVTFALALVAGVLHAARLAGWRSLATWSEPLLFVLHVAYAWLVIGYVLSAFAIMGWWFTPMQGVHALALGAVALMVLAVMTRVGLGHTGRPLHAAPLAILAYVLALGATLLRLFVVPGANYLTLLVAAGLCWMLAWLCYLGVYAPMLLGPRKAGKRP